MTTHTTRSIDVLEDHALFGNVVLVRVDFNVPLTASGAIANDAKIGMALKTLMYLQSKGSKIVICSHLGRPDGVVKKELSLAPIAEALGKKLPGVQFVDDCVGESVAAAVKTLQNGQILVLEVCLYGSHPGSSHLATPLNPLTPPTSPEYPLQEGRRSERQSIRQGLGREHWRDCVRQRGFLRLPPRSRQYGRRAPVALSAGRRGVLLSGRVAPFQRAVAAPQEAVCGNHRRVQSLHQA